VIDLVISQKLGFSIASHWGLAIRFANWVFYFLVGIAVWKLLWNEKD